MPLHVSCWSCIWRRSRWPWTLEENASFGRHKLGIPVQRLSVHFYTPIDNYFITLIEQIEEIPRINEIINCNVFYIFFPFSESTSTILQRIICISTVWSVSEPENSSLSRLSVAKEVPAYCFFELGTWPHTMLDCPEPEVINISLCCEAAITGGSGVCSTCDGTSSSSLWSSSDI